MNEKLCYLNHFLISRVKVSEETQVRLFVRREFVSQGEKKRRDRIPFRTVLRMS